MKIKKLTPENISGKTLEYKIYRKTLKNAMKGMISQHGTVETATKFLIKTNFEFADMKGKKMGFIIPGDHTSAWVKLNKEEIKGDKKNTCIGLCYVKKNADGSYVLVLLPEKGAAKKNLMKKQLEKFALKGMPFAIEIGAGGELEEDNADDAVVEDVDLPEDAPEGEEDEDEEDEDDTKKEKRNAGYIKVEEGIDKIKGVKDKAPKDKLDSGLQRVEEALQKLITEANVDGVIDTDEQKRIDDLTQKIDSLKADMQKTNGEEKTAGKKLSNEQKEKIKVNKEKINAKLDEILSMLDA